MKNLKKNNEFWKSDNCQDKDKKDSDVNEENKDLGAMNPGELYGLLDAFKGEKEAQVELTKVRNYEELCRKIKVLENDSSSKKKGPCIVAKCSDVFWNNYEASIDRISIVKKAMATKKKALDEKACLDSNSQGNTHDPLNVAKCFEEHATEENAEFRQTYDQKLILDAGEKEINLASKCCSLPMSQQVL